ncbi:hypothetical protein ACG2LH_12345 [Zhouia sp. PK063]|uniref:hypothetical protein n=1 Tax=Zhouia sp. PK063 TaxID=3373602 RepID=UPI0037AC044A
MKKIILIIFLSISINLFAQENIPLPTSSIVNSTKLIEGQVKSIQQNFSAFSKSMNDVLNKMTFFLNINTKILRPLLTIKNYKKIDKTIVKTLTEGSFIYVDSIRYQLIGKDSLAIKIFSQNDTYTNESNYRISIKENLETKKPLQLHMNMKNEEKKKPLEKKITDTFDYKIVKKEYQNTNHYNTIEIVKTYH